MRLIWQEGTNKFCFNLFVVKLYLTVFYALWCSVVNAYLHRVLHNVWLGWRFKPYPFSNLPPALNPNPGLEIKKWLLTLYPADQPSWYTKLYWKYNIQSVRIIICCYTNKLNDPASNNSSCTGQLPAQYQEAVILYIFLCAPYSTSTMSTNFEQLSRWFSIYMNDHVLYVQCT